VTRLVSRSAVADSSADPSSWILIAVLRSPPTAIRPFERFWQTFVQNACF
jgi:hypothetical protein